MAGPSQVRCIKRECAAAILVSFADHVGYVGVEADGNSIVARGPLFCRSLQELSGLEIDRYAEGLVRHIDTLSAIYAKGPQPSP